MDIVDETRSCVREKGDCGDGVQGILAPSKSFELVLVESFCGKVHKVHANVDMDLLRNVVLEKMELMYSAMVVMFGQKLYFT